MPFLAFLLGEPGPQRWASPCPGSLGPWDAHPSPTSAGCPFSSAWPAHCRPWELLSLPLSLMQQGASSCLRCCTLKPSPPLGHASCAHAHPSYLLPWPRVVHLQPGVKGLLSPQGSSCFRRGGPWVFWLLPVHLCHPPTPGVGEEQGEGAQSSFAFLRTGLHTPVCGAGLCLSSSCPGSSPPSPLQLLCDGQPWCATLRGP